MLLAQRGTHLTTAEHKSCARKYFRLEVSCSNLAQIRTTSGARPGYPGQVICLQFVHGMYGLKALPGFLPKKGNFQAHLVHVPMVLTSALGTGDSSP